MAFAHMGDTRQEDQVYDLMNRHSGGELLKWQQTRRKKHI